MRVQLSGQIPPEATNGLTPAGKHLAENKRGLVPAVVMLAPTKIIEKIETEEIYVVVRLHHIELVGESNLEAFSGILGDELAKRTGAMELPFAPGDEIKTDPFPEERGSGAEDAADAFAEEMRAIAQGERGRA